MDAAGFIAIGIVSLCFGFLSGIQMAHIRHNKRLAGLIKRCIHSGTIAPVLYELENNSRKKPHDAR
jgi:hypothetical protein